MKRNSKIKFWGVTAAALIAVSPILTTAATSNLVQAATIDTTGEVKDGKKMVTEDDMRNLINPDNENIKSKTEYVFPANVTKESIIKILKAHLKTRTFADLSKDKGSIFAKVVEGAGYNNPGLYDNGVESRDFYYAMSFRGDAQSWNINYEEVANKIMNGETATIFMNVSVPHLMNSGYQPDIASKNIELTLSKHMNDDGTIGKPDTSANFIDQDDNFLRENGNPDDIANYFVNREGIQEALNYLEKIPATNSYQFDENATAETIKKQIVFMTDQSGNTPTIESIRVQNDSPVLKTILDSAGDDSKLQEKRYLFAGSYFTDVDKWVNMIMTRPKGVKLRYAFQYWVYGAMRFDKEIWIHITKKGVKESSSSSSSNSSQSTSNSSSSSSNSFQPTSNSSSSSSNSSQPTSNSSSSSSNSSQPTSNSSSSSSNSSQSTSNSVDTKKPEVTSVDKPIRINPAFGKVLVWNLKDGKPSSTFSDYVENNQNVKTFDTKDIKDEQGNITNYTRIGSSDSNQWIQSKYFDENNELNKQETAETPMRGIATVYFNNGRVFLRDSKGNMQQQTIGNGESYQVWGVKTIGNHKFYRIGTDNQWLEDTYAKF